MEHVLRELGVGGFQYKRLYLLVGPLMAIEYIEAIMLFTFLLPEVKEEWNLTPTQDGFISFCSFFGMLFGAAIFAPMADVRGRRYCIIITLCINAVAGIVSVFSPNYWFLGLTRMAVGLASAGLFNSAYCLFSEFYTVEVRATHMLLIKCSFTLGTMLSVLLAWCTVGSGYHWRVYLLACAVPGLLMLASIPFIPESPRYLLVSGKIDKLNALIRLMASMNGTLVTETMIFTHEDENTLEHYQTKNTRGSWKLLMQPQFKKTTLALSLGFFANALAYYTIALTVTQFFPESMSSSEYILALISVMVEFPGRFIPLLLVDRVGRLPTITGLYVVYAILFIVLSISVMLGNAPAVSVLVVCLIRLCAASLWGVTNMYVVEYYPTTIRSTASGLVAIVGRFAGMAASFLQSQDLQLVVILLAVVVFFGGVLSALQLTAETATRVLQEGIQCLPEQEGGELLSEELELSDISAQEDRDIDQTQLISRMKPT